MKPVHFNLERIMSDDAALLGKNIFAARSISTIISRLNMQYHLVLDDDQ